MNSFQRSRTGDVMSSVKALTTGGFTPSQMSTVVLSRRMLRVRAEKSSAGKHSARPSPCKMKASPTLSLMYATVRRACTARQSTYAPKADLPMPALPTMVNLRNAAVQDGSRELSTPSKQPS